MIAFFRVIVTVIFMFTAIINTIQAQVDSTKANEVKFGVFTEIGGVGLFPSLNIERIIDSRFSLRVGVGYSFGDENSFLGDIITIPFSASYLSKTDADSQFEIGLSASIFYHYAFNKPSIGLLFGVRGQDLAKGGLYWRGTFTPTYFFGSKTKKVYPIIGASIGHSF